MVELRNKEQGENRQEEVADGAGQEGGGNERDVAGVKTLRGKYKVSLYAMKDTEGNSVELKDRAQALADILETRQWGEDSALELPSTGQTTNSKQAKNDLQQRMEKRLDEMAKTATMNIEMDRPGRSRYASWTRVSRSC